MMDSPRATINHIDKKVSNSLFRDIGLTIPMMPKINGNNS
jgi:hypothetical protein